MELSGRQVALYGRFSQGVRDRFEQDINERGGMVVRDVVRQSDMLIVGALAAVLIDSGALSSRLRTARERDIPVHGERAFAANIRGQTIDKKATLPLSAALAQSPLVRDDLEILSAFDLIFLEGETCRFGDAGVIRTASELFDQGRSLGQVVRILSRARDQSPPGRRKIVLTKAGEAALQWDDGLTSLEGQGFLPLDEHHASAEDLFEAATLAEAEGSRDEAARLFDACSRADRRDAIAPYNYANIRMAQGAFVEAALGYQRALARNGKLIEARYNLAQVFEATGKIGEAAAELTRALEDDPNFADAVFNLAQLKMRGGEMNEAGLLYKRYLTLGPPESWAQKAQKALALCSAHSA